jgi:hypothetical protein
MVYEHTIGVGGIKLVNDILPPSLAVMHAVLQSHKVVKSCALCSVRFVYELFLRLLFGTIQKAPALFGLID